MGPYRRGASRAGESNPPHMVYGSSRQSFTANTLLAGQEGTHGQRDKRAKQQQGGQMGAGRGVFTNREGMR